MLDQLRRRRVDDDPDDPPDLDVVHGEVVGGRDLTHQTIKPGLAHGGANHRGRLTAVPREVERLVELGGDRLDRDAVGSGVAAKSSCTRPLTFADNLVAAPRSGR